MEEAKKAGITLMDLIEKIPSSLETHTYQVESLKTPKGIGILLSLFFSVPLLVVLSLLRIYNRIGRFFIPWHSPFFWGFLLPWGFTLYIIYFRIKIRNRKIEISPEGIAQMEETGERIFIPWKEMGDLPDSGGSRITVRDRTGELKIIIPESYFKDFERIKKRVFEEYEKKQPRPAGENLVYPMGPKVGKTFLTLGVILLIISLFYFGYAVVFSFGVLHTRFSPLWVTAITVFGGMMFLVPAIYCFWHGPQIRNSKIEISPTGISRFEENGTHVFIRWDEVSGLMKRERMKQLGVYTLDPSKKIMVDYQFERFEQIRDRVLDEFEKRFRMPAMPVTFGRLPVLPNIGVLGFFGCFIGFYF